MVTLTIKLKGRISSPPVSDWFLTGFGFLALFWKLLEKGQENFCHQFSCPFRSLVFLPFFVLTEISETQVISTDTPRSPPLQRLFAQSSISASHALDELKLECFIYFFKYWSEPNRNESIKCTLTTSSVRSSASAAAVLPGLPWILLLCVAKYSSGGSSKVLSSINPSKKQVSH